MSNKGVVDQDSSPSPGSSLSSSSSSTATSLSHGSTQPPPPAATASMASKRESGAPTTTTTRATTATAASTTTSSRATTATATASMPSHTSATAADEERICGDFQLLMQRCHHYFASLRECSLFGNQWQVVFHKCFESYTKVWKFQQRHRGTLVKAYALQRWEIGDIASKIGQIYFHWYLRTCDRSYLGESFVFYDAIQTRRYFGLEHLTAQMTTDIAPSKGNRSGKGTGISTNTHNPSTRSSASGSTVASTTTAATTATTTTPTMSHNATTTASSSASTPASSHNNASAGVGSSGSSNGGPRANTLSAATSASTAVSVCIKGLRYHARSLVVALLLGRNHRLQSLVHGLSESLDAYVRMYDPPDVTQWRMVLQEVRKMLHACSYVTFTDEPDASYPEIGSKASATAGASKQSGAEGNTTAVEGNGGEGGGESVGDDGCDDGGDDGDDGNTDEADTGELARLAPTTPQKSPTSSMHNHSGAEPESGPGDRGRPLRRKRGIARGDGSTTSSRRTLTFGSEIRSSSASRARDVAVVRMLPRTFVLGEVARPSLAAPWNGHPLPCLQQAIIIGNQQQQIKFSELTLDMLRIIQVTEMEHGTGTTEGVVRNHTHSNRNPHKFLLYRPTVASLFLYLSNALQMLTRPQDAMFVYVSADASPGGVLLSQDASTGVPLAPAGNSGDMPSHSRTKETSSNDTTTPGVSNAVPKPSSSTELSPLDLIPFARHPLVVVVESPSSHVFQMFPNRFATPHLVLMSPQTYGARIGHRAGNLFTLFLGDPLMGMCVLCGVTNLSPSVYSEACDALSTAVRAAGSWIKDQAAAAPWLCFLGDPFLATMVLRYVLCKVALACHYSSAVSNGDTMQPCPDRLPQEVPMLAPLDVWSSPKTRKLIVQGVAHVLGATHQFERRKDDLSI